LKDTRTLQRYYNEHVRLPAQFFKDPSKFMESLSRGKRGIMGIYNHVDAEFSNCDLMGKYGAREFKILSLRSGNRIGYIVITPEANDEVLCKMIGLAMDKDGSNAIIRTIEIAEHGKMNMCGWTEDGLHVTFSGAIESDIIAIERLRTELATGQAFTSFGYSKGRKEGRYIEKKVG